MKNGTTRRQTVRESLEAAAPTLTPSETKIVQVILAEYPMAGLGTQASIAKKAAVSDPTVVRLVVKLGFDSFAAFQAQLLEEVEAKLRSPLMMAESKRSTEQAETAPKAFLSSVNDTLYDVMDAALPQTYERAIRLIMEARSVTLVGGRFSRHVAGMLAGYVVQFRSTVTAIGALSVEDFDRLVDMGRRDVLIVFDYRRYQTDVIAFARQAAQRGVRIVLFTDLWLSPVSEWAELHFTSRVEVASPFDTLVTAVAQIEALVAMIVDRERDAMQVRAGAFEAVRRDNGATIDPAAVVADGPLASSGRPG